MDVTARLIETARPSTPDGVVLVLHGGASQPSSPMVSPTQLSVLRMIPIARRVARAGRSRLAVYRLLNSVRGWDSNHTPVDDVQWALHRLTEELGGLPPTGLIGHSLGGRAALLAGSAPTVSSVVALNPWLHRTDTADLAGRNVLIAHGTADRIADPDVSASVAERLARTATVRYVQVRGGKHAMLRRHTTFDTLAADFTAGALLQPGTHQLDLPDQSWNEV